MYSPVWTEMMERNLGQAEDPQEPDPVQGTNLPPSRARSSLHDLQDAEYSMDKPASSDTNLADITRLLTEGHESRINTFTALQNFVDEAIDKEQEDANLSGADSTWVAENAEHVTESLALPGHSRGYLERDTRIMTMMLHAVGEQLGALFTVNSLLHLLDVTAMSDRDLRESSAVAIQTMKASLQLLLPKLRMQYLFYSPSPSRIEEPDERRQQAYAALKEAAGICFTLDEAVRQCDAEAWNGVAAGAAWPAWTGKSLKKLAECHVKLMTLRHAALGGRPGWWELWDAGAAKP